MKTIEKITGSFWFFVAILVLLIGGTGILMWQHTNMMQQQIEVISQNRIHYTESTGFTIGERNAKALVTIYGRITEQRDATIATTVRDVMKDHASTEAIARPYAVMEIEKRLEKLGIPVVTVTLSYNEQKVTCSDVECNLVPVSE